MTLDSSIKSLIVEISAVDFFFFFSSRRRHTRSKRDWSSDVCSSDLPTSAEQRLSCRDRLIEFGQHRGQVAIESLVRRAPTSAPSENRNDVEVVLRSEERRVGKECRSRGAQEHEKEKECRHVRRN